MPYAGQTLNNPFTGERIIFEQTEQDTGGALVAFEHFMLPRTMPTFPEHVQLNQEERFEIISGTAPDLHPGYEIEMNRIIERIEREAGIPSLASILAEKLSPTDLQSLLLEVYRIRSNRIQPSVVLSDFESNRFVRPSSVSPISLL